MLLQTALWTTCIHKQLFAMFFKKGVLNNFAILQENTSVGVSFIKKETATRVFSYEYCTILKNSFYYRTYMVAGSVYTLICFYKEPVYKQLALKWQIANQLSGLNPVSLSNNKNYRLRKSGVFPL